MSIGLGEKLLYSEVVNMLRRGMLYKLKCGKVTSEKYKKRGNNEKIKSAKQNKRKIKRSSTMHRKEKGKML